MNLRILFVEDSPDDVALMLGRLRKAGIEPQWQRVQTGDALREALAGEPWELALVDYNLPGFGGLEALAVIAEVAPDVPSITVSGAISEETAVATIGAGAVDYVLKSNLTRLAPAALRAVEGAELRRKQRRSAEAARLALFAVDHASLSIMTVAADGAIVYVNDFACDELGARREDLLGAKLWEYDQNASAATWSERWEAFRQSRVLEFERDSVGSDGRRRITDVTANYLEGADCLISYGRDITDKWLAEERAKASEQRYERLADNAPDIIFRYDFIPTMGLTYINPAVETITGYSPEECYADPQLMLTMVHPDDAAPMAALVQSLTPPDEPLLMRWIGKDGVSRWMESHIVPVRDTEGRLLAVEGITREVTERVEAEEALRRREREFSTLVENAPDMIVRFDTDLRYVYCNAVVAGQLGVPAQMLIGKTPLETGYPREQAEVVHQALRQALETGAEQIVEQSLPTPSGHRHFATRVVPERDEQGSIGSLLAITRDITERKQAEEALTHSRDLMRYIIEHNQSAVAVHDRDLKYIYVSERYLHDYGVKEHDVIGKGHYEVFPDLPQKWRDVHRKALAGEISSAEDDPYVRPDGAVEWTRWECRPWFEADGSIGGIIVYTEVVTARKRVDEALRVSEERNRAILQTAMDGFWLVDTDGRLLEVNETYCRMSGYSAPELLAMRIPDLEAAEAGADTVAHIERIMAQGEDRFESRHRRKDGSLFDIEASAQFRPGEGGRFVVFLRDITERKRAEEELAQSHDLLSNLARLVPGVVYQYRLYPDGSSAFPYSSPGMNDIYECTPEEVREDATPVFGRLHPDDYDRVADAIQESASTLNEFYCEFRVILPRQGLRWRWSQAHPERTEDGGTLWHGIISDITERKLAEDALRESEERFEGFAEHFPGYLFMQDEERRYVYVNRPEEKHGDVRREDWFGKTPSQVWGDDGAARAEDRVQRALDGEVVDVVEPWMPPGLHEYLHTVYFPIPRADKPPLVGGISIDVTAQVAAEEEVRRQAEQLRRTVEGAVLAISLVVETRDPYTAGHERRVSELATAIAVEMGMNGEALDALRLGGLIHDVGKIAVPAEILARPGLLSDLEFNLIKQHPQAGYDILAAIDFGLPVAEMVLQHHERLDGSGYPRGLAGEDVLPEARILAVADVVEAMSSHRPYRPALGMAAALAEVRAHAGVKYDAEVVAICARLVEERGFVFTG